MLGNFDEALDVARAGRQRYPRNYLVISAEIGALAAKGDVPALRKLIDSTTSAWTSAIATTPANLNETAIAELRAHGHGAAAGEFVERMLAWLGDRPAAELESRANRRIAYARAHVLAGKPDSALIVLGPRVAVDSLWTPSHFFATVAEIQQGVEGAADSMIAKARALAAQGNDVGPLGNPEYVEGSFLALLGRKDEAVRMLQLALRKGYRFDEEMHRDPLLQNLWDYQPFKELIKPRK
jgi:hypothetical protein